MNNIIRKLSILFLLSTVVSSDPTTLEDASTDNIERPMRQRIIGGEIAKPNDYPWFTYLGACAGSLISPEFVLTAAHCYNQNIWGPVIVGKVCKRRDNCKNKQEKFRILKTFRHPEYNKWTGSHDFMLIKLRGISTIEPVEMDDGTLSPSYEAGRENLWTAGFGYVNFEEKKRPFNLQHIPLKYVEQEVCNLDYADDDWEVLEDMMCAVNENRSKQACFGDSGGPLYDKTENKLVGITSWGDERCETKTVVYARIADQIDWIVSTICENHSSSPRPDFCKHPTPMPTLSSQPSLSPHPSMSPSVSLNPSIGPQPQSTYFQMVAKTDTNDEEESVAKLCIQGGDTILLQECDSSNKKQLWRADAIGQLRSFYREEYCLTHVRRNFDTHENLEMRLCYEGDDHRLSEVFIFNGFQNSILHVKSYTDWQKFGMKAISANHDIEAGSLVTLEWHYYGEFSEDYVQKWDIVYPAMKVQGNT